jgi:voltage-gated potassium channel
VTGTGREPGLRDRYNRFIAGHEVAWELVMAALAIVFVIAGFLAEEGVEPWLAIDLALNVLFAVEFGTRLAASYDRRAYLRGHWIDAVALIPAIRGVRLLRLLRLLRLARAFASFYRAMASFERLARHRNLLWLFFAWFAVAMICSTTLFLAENGVNPAIQTPGDAAWWGVVTLTTVGYGDTFPITPEGRLAGGALMILGITLFAAITGTITSFIVATGEKEQSEGLSVATRLRELDALHRDGVITDDEFLPRRTDLVQQL